jgi:hypothetical protein
VYDDDRKAGLVLNEQLFRRKNMTKGKSEVTTAKCELFAVMENVFEGVQASIRQILSFVSFRWPSCLPSSEASEQE